MTILVTLGILYVVVALTLGIGLCRQASRADRYDGIHRFAEPTASIEAASAGAST